MSDPKQMTLMTRLSGLALCGFMAACGQSNTHEASTTSSPAAPQPAFKYINGLLIEVTRRSEAEKIQHTEEQCRDMTSALLVKSIADDKSEEMNRARKYIFDRCPN